MRCLHARETGSEAGAGVGKWIEFYNHKRPIPLLAANPQPWSVGREKTKTNPISRSRG